MDSSPSIPKLPEIQESEEVKVIKLIEKDSVIAEIEKKKKLLLQKRDSCKRRGLEKIMHKVSILNELLSSIDTLEVKEIELNKPFEGISVKTSFDENNNLDVIKVTTEYKKINK